MVKKEIHEEPSYGESMASLLSGGKLTYRSIAKSVTLRLPALDLATVDAMCKISGSTRNKVLSILVRAGIDATKEHLDSEGLQMLADTEREFLKELVDECEKKSAALSVTDSEEKE